MKGVLYSLLVLSFMAFLSEAGQQRYIITGKFMCGTRTSHGDETSVKLLDKAIGRDTNMGKLKINRDGTFRLDGTSSGITNIDPELHIYTDCADSLPCQRRWKWKMPTKYINNNAGFDIGVVQLEIHPKDGEDRDCWH